MKNKWIKYFKLIVINGLILFLFLEVVLFIGCKISLPLFDSLVRPRAWHKPNKTSTNNQWNEHISLQDKNVLVVTNFGLWNKPSSSYIYRKACFEIKIFHNSYGARDKERKKNATTKRTIVLGDSFMEGYGIERNERLSDRLESTTERPHLNFSKGVSGMTTHSLRYQHLAQNFSHDAILIGFFPFNDFKDDEANYNKYFDTVFPSLVGTYPNYVIKYEKNVEGVTKTKDFFWQAVIRKYSHSLSAADLVIKKIQSITSINNIKKKDKDDNLPQKVGYYGDYTEQNWLRVRYSLQQIIKLAGKKKPVYLFTIPVTNDFNNYKAEGKKKPALSRRFEKMAIEVGFKYFDLLPSMLKADKDFQKYYLTCDGHWSAYGNEVAAKLLAEHLLSY